MTRLRLFRFLTLDGATSSTTETVARTVSSVKKFVRGDGITYWRGGQWQTPSRRARARPLPDWPVA